MRYLHYQVCILLLLLSFEVCAKAHDGLYYSPSPVNGGTTVSVLRSLEDYYDNQDGIRVESKDSLLFQQILNTAMKRHHLQQKFGSIIGVFIREDNSQTEYYIIVDYNKIIDLSHRREYIITSIEMIRSLNDLVQKYDSLCVLFYVHQLHAQEIIARDSVVVSSVSVFMDYCTSNDSALEFAEKKGIPVQYPLLIINGVVIRNINDVNTIRKSIHGENKRLLGPYHIVQYERYSKKQSMPFKINEMPLDGVVVISLRRHEVLGINELESWNKPY